MFGQKLGLCEMTLVPFFQENLGGLGCICEPALASVWVKPEAMHERLSRRSPCLPPSFRDMKYTPSILVFFGTFV